MIETFGSYDLRGAFGVARPGVVDRDASVSVRSSASVERSAGVTAPVRSGTQFATTSAGLLGAMFQRTGGATTSTAKGAYVDLSV